MTLPLRAYLSLWYAASLAGLLVLTVGVLAYILSRESHQEFDSVLVMLAATQSDAIAARSKERSSVSTVDDAITKLNYSRFPGEGNGHLQKYVTVVDASGRVKDYTKNLKAPLPVDEELLSRSLAGETVFQTLEVEPIGRLRAVYMPVSGTTEPLVVVVGLPESFLTDNLGRLETVIVLAIFALPALTAFGAYVLTERAIRPIEKIISAAEKITAGNLQTRLPESEARDEIGRLAAVFNQMLARIETAFRAQHRFTDRVAHELRTPLTILKGENQILLDRPRTGKDYQAQIKSNLEEVEKMERTINDLLLFARYESGETEMPRRVLPLDVVVASVVKDLRPLAREKEIELTGETEEISVSGDPQSLERLACKLIENSLCYTPRGGRVAVKVFHDEDRPVLSVSDTGIGIPAEDLPHIFERFYRAGEAQRIRPAGGGVGLALASVIARLHNAEISVESEPEKGTRFVVRFPAVSKGS